VNAVAQGSAQFQDASDTDAGKFATFQRVPSATSEFNSNPKPSTPAQVQAIPNNSGGGMPGNFQGAAARAGLNAEQGPDGITPQRSADPAVNIDQGFLSTIEPLDPYMNAYYVNEGSGIVTFHPKPEALRGLNAWLGFDLKPHLPSWAGALFGGPLFGENYEARKKLSAAAIAKTGGRYPCIDGLRKPSPPGCDPRMARLSVLSVKDAKALEQDHAASRAEIPPFFFANLFLLASLMAFLVMTWIERATVVSWVKMANARYFQARRRAKPIPPLPPRVKTERRAQPRRSA
jgi:hypothetical protein